MWTSKQRRRWMVRATIALYLGGLLAGRPAFGPELGHAQGGSRGDTVHLPLVGSYARGDLAVPQPVLHIESEDEVLTRYTDSNSVVGMTYVESEDELWVAAREGGAVRWDLSTETYTKIGAEDGLRLSSVWQVRLDPDRNLWFAGESGVDVRSAADLSWTYYRSENSRLQPGTIHHVHTDRHGNTYFGSYDGGGSILSADGTWRPMLSAKAAGVTVRHITEGPEGNTWIAFGKANVDLAVFDGDGEWDLYTAPDTLTVNDMTFDLEGNAWMVSGGFGAYRLSADRTTWDHFYRNYDGKDHRFLASVQADAAGNIWFGSIRTRNVNGRVSEPFVSVLRPDGTWIADSDNLSFAASSIAEIEIDRLGRKWFATAEGLARLTAEDPKSDPDAWSVVETADVVPSNARLIGGAAALREEIDAPLPLKDRSERERLEAALRGSLGDGDFETARREGAAAGWQEIGGVVSDR